MKLEVAFKWFNKTQKYECFMYNLRLILPVRNLYKLKKLIEVIQVFNDDLIHKDSKMDLIFLSQESNMYVTMFITPFNSKISIEIFYKVIDNYGMFLFLLDSKYWIADKNCIKSNVKLSKFYIPKVKYTHKKWKSKYYHRYVLYDKNKSNIGILELLSIN